MEGWEESESDPSFEPAVAAWRDLNLSGWAERLQDSERVNTDASSPGKPARVGAPLSFPFNHFSRLVVPLELFVVEDVIDLQRPLEHFGSSEVVDGENSAALVGVHEKCKAFGFLCVGIAR
jgi:hypothetical protein